MDVGQTFPIENRKDRGQQAAIAALKKKPNPTQFLSVIDSLHASKLQFSARNLSIADHAEEQTNEEKQAFAAYDT